MKDEYADARRNPVKSEPESVISGKTIEEIESIAKLRRQANKKMKIKSGRYTIEISNADKVLFGKSDITKGELINYYQS